METICYNLSLQSRGSKRGNKKMKQSYLLRALKELSNDLLFEYHLKEKKISFINDMHKALGIPTTLDNYPQLIVDMGLVYEKDIEEFLAFETNVKAGIEEPCYFRMYKADQSLVWCKKEFYIYKDENGEVAEVLGKIVTVQDQIEMELSLCVDGLTGCLTKHTFEKVCSRYLKEETKQKHALMIVDLDNFKAINDNLGHQFGDGVLREVGTKLKDLFRTNDYVGRIGGDEFMIFMKNIADEETLKKKADSVIFALSDCYKGEYHSYPMSCSIGIAVTTEEQQDFKVLYNQTDTALYVSKNNGKNTYTIFETNMSKGTMENSMLFEVASRGLSQHFDRQLIAEVFDLLSETKDIQASMQKVLQTIGERFGVSRAYVFEANAKVPRIYDNTYEWCDKGVSPEIDNLQGIPFELFNAIYKMSNIEGIVYCNEMQEIEDLTARKIMMDQGIKSFLHAYIGPDDIFSCNIGLDDCDKARVWSPIEISTLHHASRIIAQFLNYKQMIRKVNIVSEERYRVLDAMNFYAYIIDIENHELSFLNKVTEETLPGIKLGDKCYEVLRGQKEECFNCPIITMEKEQVSRTQAKIYNELLGRNILISASRIGEFGGKESIFVSGVDLETV